MDINYLELNIPFGITMVIIQYADMKCKSCDELKGMVCEEKDCDEMVCGYCEIDNSDWTMCHWNCRLHGGSESEWNDEIEYCFCGSESEWNDNWNGNGYCFCGCGYWNGCQFESEGDNCDGKCKLI